MKHEGDSDANCIWSPWNSSKEPGKENMWTEEGKGSSNYNWWKKLAKNIRIIMKEVNVYPFKEKQRVLNTLEVQFQESSNDVHTPFHLERFGSELIPDVWGIIKTEMSTDLDRFWKLHYIHVVMEVG